MIQQSQIFSNVSAHTAMHKLHAAQISAKGVVSFAGEPLQSMNTVPITAILGSMTDPPISRYLGSLHAAASVRAGAKFSASSYSAFALSVFSQGKSRSLLPKWPYAATCL